MTTPRLVALLPMKAHSARVPHKNFRPLAGKPLYAWMLETLLSLPEVAQVVINTDARAELAATGLTVRDRVTIRDRRPDLCGDEVSMNRIIEDDLAAVGAEVYLMTHTTNPMLTQQTLRAAVARFETARAAGEADSLFSVNRIQTRFYDADAAPVNHDPDNLIPTQDLTPWFEENSNFYLFTADSFRCARARIGRRPMMCEMRRIESVDIDDPDDWAMAEALMLRARAGAAA